MISLAEKVLEIHRNLENAALPHAFGGALALAWCTRQPRGTSDIDVNVFVSPTSARLALEALAPDVKATTREAAQLEKEGQARLHWDTTPVDVFLSTTDLHESAMQRVRLEPFAGQMIPFLACPDLAVFKAFLDRRRDWADLEDMVTARTIDVDAVVGVLVELFGPDDERIAKLRALEAEQR